MISLNGKELAKTRFLDLKNALNVSVKKPKLVGILIGEDSASHVYVKQKKQACEKLGALCEIMYLDKATSQEEALKIIKTLNQDTSVTGILLQLPVPEHLNALALINSIEPKKDVDGLTSQSMGKLLQKSYSLVPCTAKAICNLLKAYEVPIKGANVVIIGRSLIVGLPTSILLQQQGATVSLCHSDTQNLKSFVSQADIVVVSVGKKYFLNKTYFKQGAVVVDVGINREDGKLYGDVCPEGLETVLKAYSPVPGGVGPMTIQTLMENLVSLN